MSISKIRGGKRSQTKNEINRKIKKLKENYGVPMFSSFNTSIKELEKLKDELNTYNSDFDTSKQPEFRAFKNRIDKAVQKAAPSRIRDTRVTPESLIAKKTDLYYDVEILVPTTFKEIFSQGAPRPRPFITLIQTFSDYENRPANPGVQPPTLNPQTEEYKTAFESFLAQIRILCNKYKKDVLSNNEFGTYVNHHLTNMLTIAEIGLIQYEINKMAYDIEIPRGSNNRPFFDANRFSPYDLVTNIHSEANLRDLYDSNEQKFSLNNIIHAATLFKESCNIIGGVITYFESKNDVFYKGKLIQYLRTMYNYHYYSYIYYKNLIKESLKNFNNALSEIIKFIRPLGIGIVSDAQIIIYMIQKIMNNNFFIRANNFNTTTYTNLFNDILSENPMNRYSTLNILKKLFHNKERELINSFRENIQYIQGKYDEFSRTPNYVMPTANITFTHGNIMEVYGVGAALPFNGTTVFNGLGPNLANPLHAPQTQDEIELLGNNVRNSIRNAFAESILDIPNVVEHYNIYQRLLNERYVYLEGQPGAQRGRLSRLSNWSKQQWRKPQSRKTGIEYRAHINNENEVNIEESSTTNQLRNKNTKLANIVTNLYASTTYLQATPNYVKTNNGKRVENVYDNLKRIQANVQSYRARRNRSPAIDAQKMYQINQASIPYQKLKNKIKEEIIAKKNTSENNALINRIISAGVKNVDLTNMKQKLATHKTVVDAIVAKNLNTKTLRERLDILKTVRTSEKNYLDAIPVGNRAFAGQKLANIFKDKIITQQHLKSLLNVKNNFKTAKEAYNVNVNQLRNRLTKLPVGTKNIKSIKELNKAYEEVKSNINNSTRRTKDTKLRKIKEMLDDVQSKYNDIIQRKNSYPDNGLQSKFKCLRNDDHIQTRIEPILQARVPVRGRRSVATPVVNTDDYIYYHINPDSNCGRNRMNHLDIYNLLIRQINVLYEKMIYEYDLLEQSRNITESKLSIVKYAHEIIVHNIIKLIKEQIFVL